MRLTYRDPDELVYRNFYPQKGATVSLRDFSLIVDRYQWCKKGPRTINGWMRYLASNGYVIKNGSIHGLALTAENCIMLSMVQSLDAFKKKVIKRYREVNRINWKTLPEGKEKYNAYLCSPEWGRLREIVRARSGGMCENVGCSRPLYAVHHQTYIRKYQELPTDLLGLCEECHNSAHGK